MKKPKLFSTKAIHAGEEPNLEPGGTGDVVVPIHLSTTYARKKLEEPTRGYEYSRSANPTRDALEKKLAALEDAKYGLAFASGLAAETTLMMALLEKGDQIIAADDLYGGTRRLMEKVMRKFGVETIFVDATDPENIRKAINDQVKLVWLETPTNPLLKLCDIPAISDITREANLVMVVDNTFMSPYFQQPLNLGADIVLHSTTKYIGGHSDVVGGAIMLSDEGLHEKIRFCQNAMGAIPGPFDSYLNARGLKTLALRMEQHQQNSLAVAMFLQEHPQVDKVIYPGLESHPQHELAKRQMSGYGAIISFEIKGGLKAATKFLEACRTFALAESLGGVESLIEHPALMTHASVPAQVREEIGISDSLIRLSVGVEDEDALLDDIKRAFEQAK